MALQFYDETTGTWVQVSQSNPLPCVVTTASGTQPDYFNESDVSQIRPLPVSSS